MPDLQEHIKGLQDVLDELRAHEEQLRRNLLDHQDQVRRVSRALDILTERERKATKAKAKTNSNHWKPKPENVERVFIAVMEGAQTTQEITAATGLSRSTVDKSLNVLRAAERIRKTGTAKAGTSNQMTATYAVMPHAA